MKDITPPNDAPRAATDLYERAPREYTLCLRHACASASHCLRHQVALGLTPSRRVVPLANPLLTSPEGKGKCPFYRSAEKVRLAYGFTRALATVPHGKVKAVRYALMAHMCERNYYYARRGDRPLYPKEQRLVADILTQAGAPTPIAFDRYEWDYDWRVTGE